MECMCRSSQIVVEDLLRGFGRHCRSWEHGLNMRTTYHPQTDGQSERTIQTLKDMLRASHVLWVEIGEIQSIRPELVQETTNKVILIKEKLKEARDCQKIYVGNMRKHLELKLEYWTDANLHVHFEEIKVDKTLCFVEEPVDIIDREVKSLNRSRIPIVKSIGTRSEDGIGSSYLISSRICLHEFLNVIGFNSYACSDSLLLTPLCCDDIHDVTPRVSALAGCDIQARDGSSFMLDNVRQDQVTSKTLKGRKQLGEYQTGWKIKTGNVLDSCNQRSTQQCTKSGVAKHLGVAGIQQQNGLVEETNVTLLAKVVLYRNIGFNESGEYKKTFIGSGVGTGSVQVLQRVEFEVEPQEDHTFEVEPHGNVDHIVGSQEVQTHDLIYYYPAPDREQHSAWELFTYREDGNKAAFAVAAVEKIYAHESLTFNNIVACEVIFKWKSGLKDDMDARSDVYVLSNGCKKCSDDGDGYYWEYTPGMFIHLFLYIDDMGFSCGCKAEIWATKGLLDKAKGNILGDRDVEKNDKRTGFVDSDYAMGRSITMYGFMIQGCAKSWKAYVQHMKALSTTEAAHMTVTEAAKEAIWLKGLAIESGFELKIVAGIATAEVGRLRSDYEQLLAQNAVLKERLSPKFLEDMDGLIVMRLGEILLLENILKEK
ncbi:zinc finger, CCHC-type containing protein [Tanacetum coccineum]